MVHSRRPLQEKMALFWHNHFATAYSKVNGTYGSVHATKMMAGRPDQVAGNQRGQYQLFREFATGNFRELLVEVARDPAMLVWLDGRLNTRTRPQENFGREIMELFTMGIGNYTEADVVAAARVFTGWGLRSPAIARRRRPRTTSSSYNANITIPTPKTFTFAIYPDGGKTIPARPAAQGMQDGFDLIAGAGAASRDGASARAQTVRRISSARLATPDERVISASGERVHAERRQHQGGAATAVLVRGVSGRRSSSAIRGRSSSSCGRSRKPAGTGCRSTRR